MPIFACKDASGATSITNRKSAMAGKVCTEYSADGTPSPAVGPQAAAPGAGRYRSYCPDTRKYFPDTKTCAGWLKVVSDAVR